MESGARKARLEGARPLTYDTWEYRFRMLAPPEIRFRAGQFVSVLCGHDKEGLPSRRSYSIASPSQERGGFTLVVKLLPGGLAAKFFGALQPGGEIEFTGPMGFFVLDLAHTGDVVFAATGTGLAPVVPMLDELLARPESGQVQLYFGVRKLEDVFYADWLDAAAARHPRFRWQLCATQPPPDFRGHKGRLTQPVLQTVAELLRPTYYLVGNGDMIKDVKQLLSARGVDRKRQIRTEAFFAAAAP
jgi:ferredoxin-NADP reductase